MANEMRSPGQLVQRALRIEHLRFGPWRGNNCRHARLNGDRHPVNHLCHQFQIVFAGTGQLMYLLIANIE